MSDSLSSNAHPFELGLYTFVDNGTNLVTGEKKDPVTVVKNLMETIELADQTGLDVFAVGEHHREDFLVSSPAVVLGGAGMTSMNNSSGTSSPAGIITLLDTPLTKASRAKDKACVSKESLRLPYGSSP